MTTKEEIKELSLEELRICYLEYRKRTRTNKYDKKYNITRTRKNSPMDKRELVKTNKQELNIFK